MAAKIIEKKFDVQAGAVVVTIEDDLGARAVHTLHAIEPDGRVADVAALVAKAIENADARAAKIRAAFAKHGWTEEKRDPSLRSG